MSIFTRFKDISEASVDDILARSGNPRKTLRLMIQEMEDALVEMKSSCAQEMAERSRAMRSADTLAAEAERWMQRAELAVTRGREEMAREALLRRRGVVTSAEAAGAQAGELSGKIRVRREEIIRVEDKLREVRERLTRVESGDSPASGAQVPSATPPVEASSPDSEIERQLLEIKARMHNNTTR